MTPLRRRLLFGVPLALVVAGGEGFYILLRRMQANEYDPHALPSPLVGHRPPVFALPGIGGSKGFTNADIAAPGRTMLVNWFASWCAPCQEEAPLLGQLAKRGLPIWGIAYQDNTAALAAYFTANGDPYARVASDVSGRTAIDWGVYGVPETYLIDRQGIVRWRWAGALTDEVVANGLNPLLDRYT